MNKKELYEGLCELYKNTSQGIYKDIFSMFPTEQQLLFDELVADGYIEKKKAAHLRDFVYVIKDVYQADVDESNYTDILNEKEKKELIETLNKNKLLLFLDGLFFIRYYKKIHNENISIVEDLDIFKKCYKHWLIQNSEILKQEPKEYK